MKHSVIYFSYIIMFIYYVFVMTYYIEQFIIHNISEILEIL